MYEQIIKNITKKKVKKTGRRKHCEQICQCYMAKMVIHVQRYLFIEHCSKQECNDWDYKPGLTCPGPSLLQCVLYE